MTPPLEAPFPEDRDTVPDTSAERIRALISSPSFLIFTSAASALALGTLVGWLMPIMVIARSILGDSLGFVILLGYLGATALEFLTLVPVFLIPVALGTLYFEARSRNGDLTSALKWLRVAIWWSLVVSAITAILVLTGTFLLAAFSSEILGSLLEADDQLAIVILAGLLAFGILIGIAFQITYRVLILKTLSTVRDGLTTPQPPRSIPKLLIAISYLFAGFHIYNAVSAPVSIAVISDYLTQLRQLVAYVFPTTSSEVLKIYTDLMWSGMVTSIATAVMLVFFARLLQRYNRDIAVTAVFHAMTAPVQAPSYPWIGDAQNMPQQIFQPVPVVNDSVEPMFHKSISTPEVSDSISTDEESRS